MTTRPPAARVLIVEDDEAIRRFLATTLEAEGYTVFEAPSARDGETLAGNRRIDVFLIDLGLPDRDGVELIQRLRAWTQRPVIVISARSQEREKVQALDAGADDYLTKPFGVSELHARLRVALRHAAQTTQEGTSIVRFADVIVDLDTKSVRRGAELVHLTATEWRMLACLAKQAGRIVTPAQLLREVWGPGHAEQSNYLRIYMRQLRQKLEATPSRPRHLLTETGMGYRLVIDGPEDSH